MPLQWVIGDGNGAIKLISCPKATQEQLDKNNPSISYAPVTTVLRESSDTRQIQKLVAGQYGDNKILAVGENNGSIVILNATDLNTVLPTTHEWKDSRIGSQDRFVGLETRDQRVFQCSSNGHCQLTRIQEELSSSNASLPRRLRDFKVSPTGSHFSYAGNEVDVSLWDSELAFSQSQSSSSTKRKASQKELFPGEVWRAKNVPNDSLSLRQPINVSSLSFLSDTQNKSHHSIAIGNELGSVRRYDTRTARKPVADWTNIAKSGGVKLVQRGTQENELFVADSGSNLFVLDLRTGRVLYGYKGFSGSVSAMASSSGPNQESFLASTALDRQFRLHSVVPLPNLGAILEGKGNVVGKLYVTSAPTAIAHLPSDGQVEAEDEEKSDLEQHSDDNAVWNDIQEISSDEESVKPNRKRRKKEL